MKPKVYRLRHQFVDKFVFIHINKTGGSSVERALKIPFGHETALEKIARMGRTQWDRRFSFTVIRNPWDKVVSHYHFRVQTNQTNLADNPIQFNEWVKLSYGEQDAFYYNDPKMFMPQSSWIADEDGRILVNQVLRFENLSAEFDDVCRSLGKTVALPNAKGSRRGHYRDYYDEEAIRVVADWFKRDIQNFGYNF